MAELSVECQLAQVQLKRYLAGEDLPEELLADLESHLKSCKKCLAFARAKKTKAASAPASADTSASRSKFLKGLPELGKSRPFLLASAFTLVVLAMAWFAKVGGPFSLLGPTVDPSSTKVAQPAAAIEPEASQETWLSSAREAIDSPAQTYPNEPIETSGAQSLGPAMVAARLAIDEPQGNPSEGASEALPAPDARGGRFAPAPAGETTPDEVIVGATGSKLPAKPKPAVSPPKAGASPAKPSPSVKKPKPAIRPTKRAQPRTTKRTTKAPSTGLPRVPVYNKDGVRIR